MKKFILDAGAIIALLRGETGYACWQQQKLITQQLLHRIIMNLMQWKKNEM